MLIDIAAPQIETNPQREALLSLIKTADPLEEIELIDAMAGWADELDKLPSDAAWADIMAVLLAMLGNLPDDAIVARTATGVSASAGLDWPSGSANRMITTACLHINEARPALGISLVYDDDQTVQRELSLPKLLSGHFALRLV